MKRPADRSPTVANKRPFLDQGSGGSGLAVAVDDQAFMLTFAIICLTFVLTFAIVCLAFRRRTRALWGLNSET
jgi:hypothetical protein